MALLICSVIGGVIFGYITAQIKNYSGIENLKKFQPSVPTRLYDVHGQLIAELFQEKRDLTSFDQLPSTVINAFSAVEDKDFFEHFGISPMSIARAMVKNAVASIASRRMVVVQGGSTITQQLAKRLFTSGERSIARKALEAVLAFQIEKKFSKEEILEMYLNQIYLGHGCHGIATAARFFFDKDVRYLTAAESLVLAALPSKPTGNSPLKYPRTAHEKNKDSFNRMVEAGFMPRDIAEKAFNEFWPRFLDSVMTEFPTKTAMSKDVDNAPYFTDYVRQILISRFGKDVVYNDGLSVYTTLDLKRQKIGQEHLQEGVREQNHISSRENEYYNRAVDRSLIWSYDTLRLLFSLPGVVVKSDINTYFKKEMVDNIVDDADILTLLTGEMVSNKTIETFRSLIAGISSSLKVEGALIALEPKTGYITTMVGGSEFEVSNQYNRAVQARRQPGSSFKPFVYGAGIDSKRINAATVLPDAPITDIDAQGESWSPNNYEGEFTGMVSLRRALAQSINIISIRIYDVVGADKIISYASKMLKIPESRFNPSPSLALGSTEVTPFEIATGYAIYANRGRDVIPFAIRYVTDRDGSEMANIEEEVGRVIALKELNGTIQIIPEAVAFIIRNMLEEVVNGGTAASSLREKGKWYKSSAGKTGTTSNWTDAWFCGFTNDIASVVWIGYDRSFMTLGKHQAGASVAAPIWGKYMRDIYNGMKDPVFPKMPAGVVTLGVCSYTGLIPGPKCDRISGGYGLPGSGLAYKMCDGKHYEMQTVLERYMEKEGLTNSEDNK